MTPAEESQAAYRAAVGAYLDALGDLAAKLRALEISKARGGPAPSPGSVDAALERLAGLLQETEQVSDLRGRRSVLKAADAAVAKGAAPPPMAPPPPGGGLGGALPGGFESLPEVPFTEAVQEILAREPRLAGSAAEVAEIYSRERAFAAARASSKHVLDRVQRAVADALREGRGADEAGRSVRAVAQRAGASMKDWTRAYAETVFRTNAATAYAEGRFRQMKDPAVRYAIGALRFTAIKDSDTRPNHRAMDGVIAAPDWEGWQRLRPPLGYNCRCAVDFVSWPELKRMGLVGADGRVREPRVPSGAYPDPGFEHKPMAGIG